MGRLEGEKNATLSVARKMVQNGLKTPLIQEITGLSIIEIEALK